MPHSDLIRKYFSAYENKDRQAVESLLANDFIFTSPYDYRIDRETYFKRCWPYSEKSPTYGIEKLFEKGNEACILYDCKTKDGGSSRNTEFFTIEGNKIKEVEVYFGSAPQDASEDKTESSGSESNTETQFSGHKQRGSSSATK